MTIIMPQTAVQSTPGATSMIISEPPPIVCIPPTPPSQTRTYARFPSPTNVQHRTATAHLRHDEGLGGLSRDGHELTVLALELDRAPHQVCF